MAKITMYRVNGRKFARGSGRRSYGVKSKFYADVLTPEVSVVQAKLDDVAVDHAARAEARLMAHRDTGHSYIEVSSGDIDRYVSLVDPVTDGEQGGHAMSIERETHALADAFGIDPIRDLLGDGDVGRSFVEGEG